MIFGHFNARKRRPATPVGFSNRNTFAYDSKFVCSKGLFFAENQGFCVFTWVLPYDKPIYEKSDNAVSKN